MKTLLQEFSENAVFLLVCLAVFAGIILLAWAVERWTKADLRRPGKAKYTAFIAMSAALGGVLMCLEIPLFFAPSFYQLDFSELPVLITSFYLGPVAGVVTELLKVTIKLLLKGTTTAFVGDFANFVVGCTFVLPASIIYHLHKSKRMAVVGMSVGTVVMTIFGSLFNAVYLLPTFSNLFGMPMEAIIAMAQEVNPHISSVSSLVLMAVVPFNLLKCILVSVLTLVLYKRLEHALSKLMAPQQAKHKQPT